MILSAYDITLFLQNLLKVLNGITPFETYLKMQNILFILKVKSIIRFKISKNAFLKIHLSLLSYHKYLEKKENF